MKRSAAFSLIELAIVLVVIGVLVGGILMGQSLVRASELRSVSTDFQRYRAALGAFIEKYSAMPGDFANATDYWGVLDPTAATCKITAATGTATCNGDGNNQVAASTASNEPYRAWQHLANAGLIEGSYVGIPGTTVDVPGVNEPASKVTQSYWALGFSAAVAGGNINQFPNDWQNYLLINRPGSNKTITGSFPLTPEEAWSIDGKLDDGLPATGLIVALKGNATNTNCTNLAGSTTDTGGIYQVTNKNRDCYLVFMRVM